MPKDEDPYAELNQAADDWDEKNAASEETVVEAEVSEEQPETPETPETVADPDPKLKKVEGDERSAFGRRVSGIESQLEAIVSTLTNLTSIQSHQPEQEYEIPTTKEELRAQLQAIQKEDQAKAQSTQNQYQQEYTRVTFQVGEQEDPELNQEIMSEIKREGSKFYRMLSSNATSDAKSNYRDAKMYVLEKKLEEALKPKEKQNPLKGEPVKVAIGVGGGTKVEGKSVQAPKLSAYAQEFLADQARRGITYTPEKLAEIMKKDTSPGFTRR